MATLRMGGRAPSDTEMQLERAKQQLLDADIVLGPFVLDRDTGP